MIPKIRLSSYEVPCEAPESDGTLIWNSTSLIIIRIQLGEVTGLGLSYGHPACLEVISKTLAPILKEARDLCDIPSLHCQMMKAVRNAGLKGIAAHAISAIDIALWDLKAKVLGLPLCRLFGKIKECMPLYGSGGFTSYSSQETASQFQKWKELGIKKFKMKVGRDPDRDIERVRDARNAIGQSDDLFVDANGAYRTKQAIFFAKKFLEYGVSWLEEPVTSEDLEGLAFLRDKLPDINITAGEYGYTSFDFKMLLRSKAVDVLQADCTRCLGYTGFLQACVLSRGFKIPLSSHTAPALHLPACLSSDNVCHMEYFHDHVRIEERFFEGVPKVKEGCLYPYLERLGHGLELKEEDVKTYLIREEAL